MDIDIRKIEWDSAFFNMKVYSIPSNISADELKSAVNILEQHEATLAYYSCSHPLKKHEVIFDKYEFKLVDKKITYKKLPIRDIHLNASVSPYNADYPDEKLFELAIQSGIYSRFNIDKKIGKLNFEKLYNQWIINSVNKTFAEEVLVYNIDNSIVGFVTLGIKTSIGQIGIMSVDSQYRGIGIGRALITAAERWFSIHNYSGIQVITQGDNTAACRLYERCGFSKGNVEYFYHVWKK